MAFWRPDTEDPKRIVRGGRAVDDEMGISEFPHLIVNQARVLDYFAEVAANSPTRLTPDYGWEFSTLEVTDEGEYPVKVTLVRSAGPRRGPGAHRARQVRGRLRRRAQQGPRLDRLHPRRRQRQPRLGRHGRPGQDRLPRHPHQVRHPVARRRVHPAHPARGRLPVPDVRRPGRGARGRQRQACARPPIEQIIAKANEILHPLHARRAQRRLAQRVRGRPPPHRPVRRRPAGGPRHPHAARLHHRRRLPHPQRQGRPGHERVHAGRVQHRLEARPRARGPQPRIAALHLFGRAPGDREEPHRLRQGVVDDDGEEARGVQRSLRTRGLLRAHRRVPRRVHDRSTRPP